MLKICDLLIDKCRLPSILLFFYPYDNTFFGIGVLLWGFLDYLIDVYLPHSNILFKLAFFPAHYLNLSHNE